MKNLSKKQVQAIASLVETGNINETSARTGIPESTLYRWKQDPEFQKELERAQGDDYKVYLDKLIAYGEEATEALRKIMVTGTPAQQAKAADILMRHSSKAVENKKLLSRITELENLIASMR